MKLLDTTLRDGGYNLNWEFNHDFARDLYKSLTKAKIDFVELGFIYPEKENPAAGYFKCLNNEKIEYICEEKTINIAVMIDYGKFKPKLEDKNNSFIDLIRIAAHKKDIDGALNLGKKIKDLGYQVSIQCMNTLSYSDTEIKKVLEKSSKNKLDYIYIADSFGSMMPYQLKKYLHIFKQYPVKSGLHAHNNIELSFINSITAMDNDIDIIDCCVLGLGRGSGNLRTELFLSYLENIKYNNISVKPILEFIKKYNNELFKYKIKDDINLIFTGILNIHPNYGIEANDNNIDYDKALEKFYYIKKNIQGYQKGLL